MADAHDARTAGVGGDSSIADADVDYAISDAMIRFGGGFVSRLGELFRAADAVNKIRLKHAFPDYWAKYAEMARTTAPPLTEAELPSAADVLGILKADDGATTE